jgi:hypothetical protein
LRSQRWDRRQWPIVVVDCSVVIVVDAVELRIAAPTIVVDV